MHESLEAFCCIDLDDMEFKDTMKDARNKLELATESTMPCEARNLGHGARCEHDTSTCENNNPGFQVTILWSSRIP